MCFTLIIITFGSPFVYSRMNGKILYNKPHQLISWNSPSDFCFFFIGFSHEHNFQKIPFFSPVCFDFNYEVSFVRLISIKKMFLINKRVNDWWNIFFLLWNSRMFFKDFNIKRGDGMNMNIKDGGKALKLLSRVLQYLWMIVMKNICTLYIDGVWYSLMRVPWMCSPLSRSLVT